MSATSTDIDHIRVRYATFRGADSAERSTRADELHRIRADERLLLETCHRVELVTVEAHAPADDVLSGRDAVLRVFEVVAGFDSAVVAEEQLLGQVRAAYDKALSEGSTGPVLNELMRRALRFGRRVRSHALPGTDRSLADLGVRWLLDRIDGGSHVLVAGTGAMGASAAMQLAAAGHRVTVVSGSPDRATRLVSSLRGVGHAAAVGGLAAERLSTASGVVLAVRTREPLLTAGALGDAARPYVLDLSVPAAVSTDAGRLLGDRLMTVDGIASTEGAAPVLAPRVERRLRRELADEVDGFAEWVEQSGSADAVALLQYEAESLRRRHLDRLRGRAGLRPEQVAAVDAASAAMLRELLHRPSVALRRGNADAEAVRRLFGLGGQR